MMWLFDRIIESKIIFLQTGSGKTYTMMGDIDNMDGRLGDDCGITPRIFEYLFSRIRKVDNRVTPVWWILCAFYTSDPDLYLYI